MIMNSTDKFIDHLFQMGAKEIPPDVLHQAKRCLLDYLGCALAGSVELQQKGVKIEKTCLAKGRAGLMFGDNLGSSMPYTALLNGMFAHVLEMDDGERYGMVHPGAPVISALLPLVRQHKVSGRQFLHAIIIGYEATLILARAMQPELKLRGYHATGVCGTIGATMAVAHALKLDRYCMKNALSVAATSASGLLEVIRDSSELKPFNAGHAAMSGLNAAILAQAGFNGPDDVLGGKQGLISAMAGRKACDVLEYPDNIWTIQGIYTKPYAACRHCHAPIEAALTIRNHAEIEVDVVKDILVETYKWAVHLHDHAVVCSVSSAKMSTPYSVAVALETGRASLAEYSESSVARSATLALAKKVRVCVSDALTERVPAQRAAIVTVTLKDGTSHREMVELPKGEPEKPMSDAEVIGKFTEMCVYAGISEKKSELLSRYVWNIDECMDKLMSVLGQNILEKDCD